MVAGILEKSKRLRSAFFFNIRNTPKLFCAQPGGCTHRETAGTLAMPRLTARTRYRRSRDTQMRPQGQRVPQAPFAAHGRFDFVFSAPVSRACSRPAARETVANPCSAVPLRFHGSNIVEGRSLWMK